MKLLINTSSNFKGGGIQVAKSFIEECKRFDDNEYFVVLSEKLVKEIQINEFPNNFTFFNAPFRPAKRVFSLQSHNQYLKDIENKFKPDVVFTTSGPSYWRPKAPQLMGYNLPNYIYSESPYFKIISFKSSLRWKGMKLFAHYIFNRDADAFVVQTDDVNHRLRKYLSVSKVFTVSNTINSNYREPKKVKNKLPTRNNAEFRLLTLSAWYPHKNLNVIPEVIDSLNIKGYSNIKFITTLPEVDFKKLKNNKNILNVGSVVIEEGASLYKECDAMFLPTLLECFSASYAEAMIMGKPILTSNMGFAHAVCENAALYFNPMDVDDIADKIIELYKNNELQDSLIKKGLKRLDRFGTAKGRAKQILEICKSLMDEN